MTPDESRELQAAGQNVPPVPTPEIFSDAAAQAALARLKAKAAARQAAADAPPPPGPRESVELSAGETTANPEEPRRQFASAIAGLREAFAGWVAAKEEQFEQVLALGWSGQHEDLPSFLKHLEEERHRLAADADSAEEDVFSSTEAAELEDRHELLQAMKVEWDKLRAEGVPIEKRPLAADLPWSVQFQFQAETDPTGKDMEWWRAHKDDFADLE